MYQKIQLIDRDGKELKMYQVENWDEDIEQQFSGDETELYRDSDGEGEFDYETKGIQLLSALDAEQDTEISYNGIYVGKIHYERSRSMEEYREARKQREESQS
jgi:hypothetical protein